MKISQIGATMLIYMYIYMYIYIYIYIYIICMQHQRNSGVHNIYPKEMITKNTKLSQNKVTYLDLEITIIMFLNLLIGKTLIFL